MGTPCLFLQISGSSLLPLCIIYTQTFYQSHYFGDSWKNKRKEQKVHSIVRKPLLVTLVQAWCWGSWWSWMEGVSLCAELTGFVVEVTGVTWKCFSSASLLISVLQPSAVPLTTGILSTCEGILKSRNWFKLMFLGGGKQN